MRACVARAMNREWSSARAHCVAGISDAVLEPGWMDYFGGWNYDEWRDLPDGDEGCSWAALRRAALTEKPLGSRAFVKELEKTAGRRYRRWSVAGRGRAQVTMAARLGCKEVCLEIIEWGKQMRLSRYS